ncbi:MAG TPA: cache domain-containing protein [Candidatus Acidoferrum sp.]|nr:cache domain-containing protein [Candidatus Acidoferrum sp.]
MSIHHDEKLFTHNPQAVATTVQQSDQGKDTTGSSQEDEYVRLNRLLTAQAQTTYESMEEIQHINMRMRMISFNSKIEAARAGESGRAFSVVSDEMKALSDRTATVAQALRKDSARSTEELKAICMQLSTQVRGTRLSDLALTNIDLIDRNLYERSCDVRWWATDASLVDALVDRGKDACDHAGERMGVILNAYTVYFDLVLCDANGTVVANGRPQRYRSRGMNQSIQSWFQQAMQTQSGEQFGFESVHPSPLVNNQRVLVYSAAVREGGKTHGRVLGALGIVFNYDALAQVIMRNTPIGESLKSVTRVCITDGNGKVLADSHDRVLQDTLDFPGREQLYRQDKGFAITDIGGASYCIAHAKAPGFETYTTGWHSVILQPL